MKYVTKSTNTEFNAIINRRSNPKSVMVCKVLKSGKIGKPRKEMMFGAEKTVEDVIARLESLNPGMHWVAA